MNQLVSIIDMLTLKQYEAVGRLTLAFNDIEFVIETYTTFFIGSPEYAVSEWLAEKGMFQQKVERLESVLKALVIERPLLESAIKTIMDHLQQAKELASQRNLYVHAMVVYNFEKDLSSLRRRFSGFGRPPTASFLSLNRKRPHPAASLETGFIPQRRSRFGTNNSPILAV